MRKLIVVFTVVAAPLVAAAPAAAATADHPAAGSRDAAPTSPRRRRDGVGMRRRARGALRPGVRGQRLGPGAAGGGLIVR